VENKKPETAAKKPKQKNLFWIILVIILAIGAAIVGWGFYNGARVRSYAKEVKSIMEDSNKAWTMQDMENENTGDLENIRIQAETIKADSEEQLAKLDKLSVPRRTNDLNTKVLDYFNIAKNMSTEVLEFLDYAEILEDTQENLASFGGTITGVESFIKSFEELHESLVKNIENLETANPPATFKEFNAEYLEVLKKFDALIVKAIKYAKNNQMEKVENLSSESDEIIQEFNQIYIPNESEALEEIVSEEEKNKLLNYPEEIKKDVNDLIKIKFSF